jgi:PTS system glucitol/sorbitol-specific IIA component
MEMKVIYENQVKALGSCVEEFKDAGLFIIFGDDAPEELKDYCYSVSVTPIQGRIEAGQTLCIDEEEFLITAVGSEVPVTLGGLGHCSISLSGLQKPELPGTIYVEKKDMPKIKTGTILRIVA